MEHARSFLFVPGHRLDRLPNALASGAHAVVVDLEDAVATDDKDAARQALGALLRTARPPGRAGLLVRINPQGSAAYDDDLAMLRAAAAGQGLAGVMLPKAESVSAIGEVALAAGTGVLALIESAAGFDARDVLARAPQVRRIAFGHLDFQLDLGLAGSDDQRELDAVRLSLVLASRRADLPPPVDGVTPALGDAGMLNEDIARSRRFGFGGKLCIHPAQVAAVNAGLRPTPDQQAWARRVLDAAADHGGGVFRLGSEMVDEPVLRRARLLLGNATAEDWPAAP